jgi:leucyl aminopeptidase
LGEGIAGLYSNNDKLRTALESAAKQGHEAIWPLPLENSYKKSIKSNIADLKNLSSNKGGGSITAALFLQEFVNNKAWAHIGKVEIYFFQSVNDFK